MNLQEFPSEINKYKLFILLDEFTSIGKIDSIITNCSFIAGYGVKLILIYQSEAQLRSKYGKEDAQILSDNISTKIYFTPANLADAKNLSENIGFTSFYKDSKSFSKKAFSSVDNNYSTQEQEHKRALILPQELMQLEDNCIIESTRNGSKDIIKAKKIKYYADTYFIDKLKSVSPYLKQIKGLPNKKEIDFAMENDLNCKIKEKDNEN